MGRRVTGSIAAVVAAVALVGGVAAQLVHVHAGTGRWGLSYADARAPVRIHVEGRDYERGGQTTLPDDVRRQGRTDGGGEVYRPRGELGTATGMYVVEGGRTWAYGLVGGP